MWSSTALALTTRLRSRLATLVTSATLLCLAGTAVAEKRVVVLDFVGPRTGRYQAAVTKMIAKKHTVVAGETYARTARKLGAARPTSANVSAVARELEANAVLIGIVKRKRGRYTLRLRLRAGVDGEFSATTIKADSKKPRLTAAQLRRVRRALLAAIDELPPLEAPPADYGEGGDDDGDDYDDDGDGRGGGGGDDDYDGYDDGGTIEKKSGANSALSDAEQADLDVRGRGMDIAAGLSFSARTLSFTVRDGLGDLAPRGYEGTMVPGANIFGELYPLAFNRKKKSALHNVGVTFSYDQAIKIESRMLYDDGSGSPAEAILPTAQTRWGVGLVYRYNFGKQPTSPTIKASLRYSSFAFVIDKSAAPGGVTVDIPNMEYAYYDPGLALRFPVAPKLALLADARLLLVTGAGEMQAASEYGASTITGYDVDIGFEYKINPRASLRAGGRFTGINLDFDGSGSLTSDRDGDGSSQDVTGASDQLVGGYLVAGYLF